MQLELAQKIVSLCEDMGYGEDNEMPEVREDYGYGYSRKTTAITGLPLTKLIAIILESLRDNVDRIIKG